MELRQVHVITRHGSRRPLVKNAMTLEESASEDSFLTPLGQQQHYQLGVWLRDRYLTQLPLVLQQFDPTHVLIESSSYERTLSSANALTLGLFPPATRGLQVIPDNAPPIIPVYTVARQNDVTIRAYSQCPAHLESLQALYDSQQWHQMERTAMPLLRKLAQIPGFRKYVTYNHTNGDAFIPLTELWNVFDAIHVAKVECPDPVNNNNATLSQVCRELPDPTLAHSIEQEDWAQVQELSHAIELLKYGPDIAGNLLGGTIWNEMKRRLQETDDNNDESTSLSKNLAANRFYVSSAHYPTILGLFAALKLPFSTDDDMVIPEYASALIVELYQDVTTAPYPKVVKLVYKSGTTDTAVPVQWTDTNICRAGDLDLGIDGGCVWDEFVKQLDTNRLTPEEWCLVCGNTKADVCVRQALATLQESCSTTSSSGTPSNAKTMAALYFAGIFTMAALVILKRTLCASSRRRGGAGTTTTLDENNAMGNVSAVQADKPTSVMEDIDVDVTIRTNTGNHERPGTSDSEQVLGSLA